VQAQTQSELSAKIIADSLQAKPDTLKSFLLKKRATTLLFTAIS